MKIEYISEIELKVEEEFSLKKLMNKRVLSKSGQIVGNVKDIVIKNYRLLGILIKKRFHQDLFIETRFFDSFKEEAIILSIDPVTLIPGLVVFDRTGKKLGKVSHIIRQTEGNEFSEFLVKRGLFKKDKRFKHSDIDTISQNVILNIDFDNK